MKTESAKVPGAKGAKKPVGRRTRRPANGLLLSHATPIYVQLIMYFRQQIESGKWSVNSVIPSLEELAAEFGVTRASVGCGTKATYDPLTSVTAQVQHQVADAVRLVIRTPPDLFVVQLLEAPFNFR